MRVAFASQVETLEQQLRAADQKVAALEKKLEVSEAEKLVVREQLVAADAELFVYRQAQTAPKFKDEVRLEYFVTASAASGVICSVLTPLLSHLLLLPSAQILEAIQQSNQYQFASSNLLENKLASIHDTLEEIRHYSGERTETDDSPQKKDRYERRGSCAIHACMCMLVCVNALEVAAPLVASDRLRAALLRGRRSSASAQQLRLSTDDFVDLESPTRTDTDSTLLSPRLPLVLLWTSSEAREPWATPDISDVVLIAQHVPRRRVQEPSVAAASVPRARRDQLGGATALSPRIERRAGRKGACVCALVAPLQQCRSQSCVVVDGASSEPQKQSSSAQKARRSAFASSRSRGCTRATRPRKDWRRSDERRDKATMVCRPIRCTQTAPSSCRHNDMASQCYYSP